MLENGKFTREAIAEYWQDGFLFPVLSLDPAQALAWRKQLEALERAWLGNTLHLPSLSGTCG
jgi:hypothetical protein